MVDPQEVERASQAISGAIESQNFQQAHALLDQLGQHLPLESITMLRLNAWLQMKEGHDDQAVVLYRQIMERMPYDEIAGVNLALLYSKAGKRAEAKRLISALVARYPQSPVLARYSQELDLQK
jgi:predicted Zn-dependent protease